MTIKTNPERRKETGILVNMLRQAARLEHSLLNCYLYTAASIKSMPQEFEFLVKSQTETSGSHECRLVNRRRAIHFEKARQWKQSILQVSHEEMRHLHYVQCLLRALGESPDFTLPDRDASGNWIIPNWDIYTSDPQRENTTGTQIPLDGLTTDQIKKFILFESTDSLQDNDPFGDEVKRLFQDLYDFELDFQLESIVYNIDDPVRRTSLKEKLKKIYLTLLPADEQPVDMLIKTMVDEKDLGDFRFQSIGDLYMKGILPLYQQAFDHKEVPYCNFTFNNELQGDKAAEGFLPIGPVYRSKNYEQAARGNDINPLRYFKNVQSIISEIVEEGEGQSGFEEMARDFLAHVARIGGVRKYLEICKADTAPRNCRSEDCKDCEQCRSDDKAKEMASSKWFQEAQLCRMSHLYRFAITYMDMEFEKSLSERAGVMFNAARSPVFSSDTSRTIGKMTEEIPRQFNACYLVMLSWLSRIYEIKLWQTDKDRRGAIEMLATWPLMSLAIRPFLELASFFDIDKTLLYRLSAQDMPGLPLEAKQLAEYFSGSERNRKINEEMDYLAMRVLSNTAQWAAEQIAIVEKHFTGNEAEMILTRLRGLSRLNEFEKQFPFRVHGGYSNQAPDLNYILEHEADQYDYAENPSDIKNNSSDPETSVVFKNTPVLKLRFGGFGLVQLSTDPDPPTDESGCSGTHMLHASDKNNRFDRAIVWQTPPGASNIIQRGPHNSIPRTEVNLIDMTLQMPGRKGATAGYIPLQIMNSTGAVQTSGVQQALQIQGLNDLVSFGAGEITGDNKAIRFNLLDKNGERPILYGDNHLVSKDGEPIDPFILSITDNEFNNLLQREIYNQDISMRDMNPLQRVLSSRWPAGFDNIRSIPDWLIDQLPKQYANLIKGSCPPLNFITARTTLLYKELEKMLENTDLDNQNDIDQIISIEKRIGNFVTPKGTTIGWLSAALNYGHSISGSEKITKDNLLVKFIRQKLKINIDFQTDARRNDPNSRWVIKYTLGMMDTDSISNLVYGELFIPIKVRPGTEPFTIERSWSFPDGMKNLVADYACRFHKPFWADFQVADKIRSTQLGPEYDNITIKEYLESSDDQDGYTYTATGVKGIHDYTGSYQILENDDQITLKLKVQYKFEDTDAYNLMTSIVSDYFKAVDEALVKHFSPR